MTMHKFKARVKHDKGQVTVCVDSTSEEAAIKQIMSAEGCPRRSILKIVQVDNWKQPMSPRKKKEPVKEGTSCRACSKEEALKLANSRKFELESWNGNLHVGGIFKAIQNATECRLYEDGAIECISKTNPRDPAPRTFAYYAPGKPHKWTPSPDAVQQEAEEVADKMLGAPKQKQLPQRADTGGISPFTRHYIICALWSETGDDEEPLDKTYDVDSLAPEALQRAEEDCTKFQTENAELLARAYEDPAYLRIFSAHKHECDNRIEALAGHDFWLSRNGHGSGFFDRGLDDEVGDGLQEAAQKFGTVDLYVGDDGQLYF